MRNDFFCIFKSNHSKRQTDMKYKSELDRILPLFILILTGAVGRSSAYTAADSGKLEIQVIMENHKEMLPARLMQVFYEHFKLS